MWVRYNESSHWFSRISQIFYVCVIVLLRFTQIFIRPLVLFIRENLWEEKYNFAYVKLTFLKGDLQIAPTTARKITDYLRWHLYRSPIYCLKVVAS